MINKEQDDCSVHARSRLNLEAKQGRRLVSTQMGDFLETASFRGGCGSGGRAGNLSGLISTSCSLRVKVSLA